MECTSCKKAYPIRTSNPFCTDSKCPEKGQARLQEKIRCPDCNKDGTTVQIGDWVREDWQKGPYHSKFEELREKMKKRLPRKK